MIAQRHLVFFFMGFLPILEALEEQLIQIHGGTTHAPTKFYRDPALPTPVVLMLEVLHQDLMIYKAGINHHCPFIFKHDLPSKVLRFHQPTNDWNMLGHHFVKVCVCVGFGSSLQRRDTLPGSCRKNMPSGNLPSLYHLLWCWLINRNEAAEA